MSVYVWVVYVSRHHIDNAPVYTDAAYDWDTVTFRVPFTVTSRSEYVYKLWLHDTPPWAKIYLLIVRV